VKSKYENNLISGSGNSVRLYCKWSKC